MRPISRGSSSIIGSGFGQRASIPSREARSERERAKRHEGYITMTGREGGRLLTGSELRRLLVLRDRARQEIVGAPRSVQREALQAMEAARRLRQEGQTADWRPPQMTGEEYVREIKWRLDVAALTEVEAATRVLDRAARRVTAAARRREPAP
jgi:hypothetical protein